VSRLRTPKKSAKNKDYFRVRNINKYLARKAPSNPPRVVMKDIIPNAATCSLLGIFLESNTYFERLTYKTLNKVSNARVVYDKL